MNAHAAVYVFSLFLLAFGAYILFRFWKKWRTMKRCGVQFCRQEKLARDIESATTDLVRAKNTYNKHLKSLRRESRRHTEKSEHMRAIAYFHKRAKYFDGMLAMLTVRMITEKGNELTLQIMRDLTEEIRWAVNDISRYVETTTIPAS